MTTLKNLSLALTLVLTIQSLSYGAIFGEENLNRNKSSKKSCNAKNPNHYVHAVLRNGEMIPEVVLPEITITAERTTKNMVRAGVRGNSIIAVVDLPEVTIQGKKVTPGYSLKSLSNGNVVTYMVDLPEVVISSKRVGTHSFAWQKTNQNNVPVVTLPEIIITSAFPGVKMTGIAFYNGNYIPSVNLPVVEITAEKPGNLLVSNDLDANLPDDNLQTTSFVKLEMKSSQDLKNIIRIIAKTLLNSI